MDYNQDKLDETILALLYLNSCSDHETHRAWKGFDWEAMDRLYDKGYISDPKRKAKSVLLTEDGAKLAKAMFEKYFV